MRAATAATACLRIPARAGSKHTHTRDDDTRICRRAADYDGDNEDDDDARSVCQKSASINALSVRSSVAARAAMHAMHTHRRPVRFKKCARARRAIYDEHDARRAINVCVIAASTASTDDDGGKNGRRVVGCWWSAGVHDVHDVQFLISTLYCRSRVRWL